MTLFPLRRCLGRFSSWLLRPFRAHGGILALPVENGPPEIARKRRAEARHIAIARRCTVQGIARRPRVGLRQFFLGADR